MKILKPTVTAALAHLQEVLDRLVDLNLRALRAAREAGEPLPPIYASGVQYDPSDPEEEQWRLAPEVLEARSGDAVDLVAWRAAELRLQGVDARAGLERDRDYIFVFVVLPDGSVEDVVERFSQPHLRQRLRSRVDEATKGKEQDECD